MFRLYYIVFLSLVMASCQHRRERELWEDPVGPDLYSEEGSEKHNPIGQIPPEEEFEATVVEDEEPFEPDEIAGVEQNNSLLLSDRDSIKRGPETQKNKLNRVNESAGVKNYELEGRKNKFLVMKAKGTPDVFDKPNGSVIGKVKKNFKVKVYSIKNGWGKLSPSKFIRIKDFNRK